MAPISIGTLSLVMLLLSVSALTAGAQDAGTAAAPAYGTGIKEPVAKGIEVGKIWDGRHMAPFRAIDNPNMVKAAEADFMTPDDYVLGVTVNGESRAYPTRFVWFHHVVNDTFKAAASDTHVAITYCSVCNTGIRYEPMVNGKLVMIDFFGLYNGIVALCDRETESIILQGEGRIINGPLVDTHLKTAPLLDTTWSQWLSLHPDTLVMSPDTQFKNFYSPKEHPEPRGYDHFPAPYFLPTVTRGDLRLPAFDKVLGTAIPLPAGSTGESQRRAYPIKTLISNGGVVNETVGETHISVFYDPKSAAAVAVNAMLGRKLLTFELHAADGKIGIFDTQTGTRWSIEGVALEGKLKGKSLERLDSHLSQWYGWCACFPDTTIFGSDVAPKPGNLFEKTAKAEE